MRLGPIAAAAVAAMSCLLATGTAAAATRLAARLVPGRSLPEFAQDAG